jgi:2-haloacid dehalogenase
MVNQRYDAVVFDLLTALLDSWSLWNRVAGSEEEGRVWRGEYLSLTYLCGSYRPYEDIIREAAAATGIPAEKADDLINRWHELEAWPEAEGVLALLEKKVPLGIATNSSNALADVGVAAAKASFSAIVTAESAGQYKPRSKPYELVLQKLGVSPERTLFVAGSSADIPGATAVGMTVYWHNRAGLKFITRQARPIVIADSLTPLVGLV